MERKYVDWDKPITKRRRKLPHWEQDGACYFVTWRLADALPQELLKQWEFECHAWMTHHPEPWSAADEAEYHERFSQAVDRHLDAGHGSCVLRDPAAAQIVADTLLFFEGQRSSMWAFVVMPNHVHALFSLLEGHELEKMMFTWKRFTSGKINEAAGRSGNLWQAEYFDRLIRHEAHFEGVLSYILENPAKAKLRKGDSLLWLREKL